MIRLSLDRDYKAAIYLRLSREDGDDLLSGRKSESDSITSQRMMILDFLKKYPEITVVEEFCDDGYTGANFERPGFNRMMEAVKQGKIDCIVVKDLSRFGREYIGAGEYIQKVFPRLGVRFIAINDHYDNAQPGAVDNELILPFKNLMNDSYCRDISIKVRTNLEAKRRNGQFIAPRVVYGYLRDPENKNRMIVDPEAAAVVQDIFRWKLEGLSPGNIAKRLNDLRVLSPNEYKKVHGNGRVTGFQPKGMGQWTPVAIHRILKNEMYIGTLVQGKTTSPNHKVKKKVQKPSSEWSRTENAHEAIISASQFDLVQQLMKEDTRCPTGGTAVTLFAGKVFCKDCGSPMLRKTPDAVYICSGNKHDTTSCSTSHRIRESKLYDAVLAVLQTHIAVAMDMEAALKEVDALAWENRELEKIKTKITLQEENIDKYRRLKVGAYEDFQRGIISKEEYKLFRGQFDEQIAEANEAITRLIGERNSIMGGLAEQQGWLAQFKEYENIRELTRRTVVSLIDRIYITQDHDIEIKLLHYDRFASILEFLKERKEAV